MLASPNTRLSFNRRQLMMMSEGQEIDIDRHRSPYQFPSDYGVIQDNSINSYISWVGKELASCSQGLRNHC